MGLEPLDEGLQLHDRLCVEEEGRDTPAMVTCESRASLATTPAAFASESLTTVACESSAATSDIVVCESAAAVACKSSAATSATVACCYGSRVVIAVNAAVAAPAACIRIRAPARVWRK